MADSSYTIQAVLSLVDKGFSNGFKKAISAAGEFNTKLREHTSNAGTAMQVAGGAISAFGIGAVKSFGSFQAGLNKAAVVAGGSQKDIKGLSDVANEMAKDLPIDAQDASNAMINMAQNGAGIKQLKDYFPPIAKAATAAGADLDKTAGAVQESMNIWGGSAKRNAAVMVQTANLSNASIETMDQAFSNVGTNSKALGMSIDTTSEAIGLLTNRGMTSARASMDLNHSLVQMIKPSKSAQGVMQQLGISYTDAHGKMKPFKQILEELNDALANYTPAQKQAALATLFGTSGEQAMLPLMEAVANTTGNASNSWDAYEKQLKKTAGTSQAAGKTLDSQASNMQKNVGSAIEQIGGSFDDLKNTAMQSEDVFLRKTLNNVADIISKVQNSHDVLSTVIKDFIGLSPILGPVIVGVGTFAKAISSISTLMNPWVLFGATLAVLAGKFVEIYNASKPLQNAIKSIGDAFKSVFGDQINSLLGVVKDFFDSISGKSKKSSKQLSGLGNDIAKSIRGIDWKGIFQGLSNAINDVVYLLKKIPWKSIFGSVKTIAADLFDFFKKEWQILKSSGILAAVGAIAKGIGDLVKGALKTLEGALPGLLQNIEAITQVLAPIITLIGGLIGVLASVVGKVLEFYGQIQKTVPLLSNLGNMQFGSLFVFLKFFTSVHKKGESFTQTLKKMRDGLKTFVNNVKTLDGWLGKDGKFKKMIENLKKLGGNFKKWGTSIHKTLGTVGKWFGDCFKSIRGGLSKTWSRIKAWGPRLSKARGTIGKFFTKLRGVISKGFSKGLALLKKFGVNVVKFAKKFGSTALKLAQKAGNGLVKVAQLMARGVKTAISAIVSAFKKMLIVISANPYAAAIAAVAAIVAALVWFFTQTKTGRRLWSNFVKWFKNLWQNLSKWLSNLWNGMKKAAENIWNAIKNVIKWYVNTYKMIITKIWGATIGWVIKSWSNMFKSVKDIFEHGHYYMTHPIKAAQKLIGTYIDQIRNLFKSLGMINLWNAGKKVIDGFLNGIKSGYEKVKDGLHNITKDIPFHKGPLSVDEVLLVPAGQAIMRGLNSGIIDKYRDVQQTLRGITADIATNAQTLPSTFNDQLDDISVKSRMSLQSDLQRQQLQIDRRPAYINVSLGGHQYSTFVKDISDEQDRQYDLQRRR